MPPRRSRCSRGLTRAVAGALAVTALPHSPPSRARSTPASGWTASPPPASQSDAEAPAPTVIRTVDDGFDWGSAGIGAGATAALVLLTLSGVRAGSRTRVRPAR